MDFTKKGAVKAQKELVSKLPRNRRKFSISFFKALLVLILAFVIVGVGAGFGALKGILDDTPNVNAEALIPTGYKTKLVYQNGKEITTLANFNSNREYVYYDSIPADLVNAFVAIEDRRFWEHNGIDVQGIARAFIQGLSKGDFDEGASTLTQQLIKNNVFNVGLNETTFLQSLERKVQEQYLAVEMEKQISKEHIVEYYLNTINLGQNTLGVQAAAKRYFDKDVSELTISESAVLAGITQNPAGYNPITHPKRNAKKRTTILSYMKDQGYITSDEYDKAMKDKVYARIKAVNKETTATQTTTSYFTDALIDQVISDMKNELGYTETQAYNALYRGGLTIYTTQDASIQKVCDNVINNPSYYPAGSTYQLSYQLTVTDAEGVAHNYNAGTMKNWFAKKKKKKIPLYYTDKKKANQYIKVYKKAMSKGTGCQVEGEKIDFVIQPQVSFVVMDQTTGQVKAICGGRGEKTASRTLNRASTSLRQPGSTYKILSTYLPALDTSGMTLVTQQKDEPYYYPGTKRLVRNWYRGYRGTVTIRKAIADSMNVIAVKTLEQVTPKVAYDYLLNLGFTSLVESYTDASGKIYSDISLPMALGGLTKGVSNLELTTAFASVANGGVYNKATFYTKIVDHDGNVLLDKTPVVTKTQNKKGEDITVVTTSSSKQVMKDSTAYLLTSAMQDVVNSGTGTAVKLRGINVPVAGKTGTSTGNKDLWFVGYTPYLTAGIWGGYDASEKQSNTTYHKAIWKAIMEKLSKKHKDEKAKFTMPSSVVSVRICTVCGKPLAENHYSSQSKKEYFAKGTVPEETCSIH